MAVGRSELDHEDDKPLRPVPALRPEPADPEETLPPAEPGTEASAALPPFPRHAPPGPVGIETILFAIREVRESVDGKIDRVGEDVSRLIPEVKKLGSRVSGFENAIDRRRQADQVNQDSMRTQIQNLCSAFEGFRLEVSGRIDNLEGRVSALEAWRESQEAKPAAENGPG